MKKTHIKYQARVKGSSMIIPGETLDEVKAKIAEYSGKHPGWKFELEKVTTTYETITDWNLGDEFTINEDIHLSGERAGDICRVIGFDPDGVAVHYSNLTRDLNDKFLPDSPFATNLIERI